MGGISRRNPKLFEISMLFAILWLVSAFTFAQLPTATILGVVKDTTGAVIPGAAVAAKNVDTGFTRNAITGNDGSYRIPALPVGNYEVRVQQPGFEAMVKHGVSLTVSQEAVLNFGLEVGAVQQTVSVTAEAPLVNTTTGSLGGLVSESNIAELPLNGRNYIDLTLLQPGIQQHLDRTNSAAGSAGTWFSSNGATPRSNNLMLDGAIMQNSNGGTSASVSGSTLGIEGVREYRIITNSFSAEYGLTMGSQMVIVTKSGTNTFHGSLFDYLRNNVLDARNFFQYKTLSTPFRLPPYRRNDFGAAGGGPIRKDKTFFWATYEGLRERLGITTVDNVPQAGCHGGAGAVITNTACPLLGSTPSVTISSVTAPFLAFYPKPNLGSNQFTFPFTQPTREDFGELRIDDVIGGSDSLFGRYTTDDTTQNQTQNFPEFFSFRSSRSTFITLSESHVFSPNLLNTARVSMSRPKISDAAPYVNSGPNIDLIPGKGVGSITIGGISGLSPDTTAPTNFTQTTFTYSDDLFLTRGRHSLKFGTLINRYRQYVGSAGANSRGNASFANFQAFLLGQTTNYAGTTPGSVVDRDYRYLTMGFYAQDDFRASSRLTLNVGLRYEPMSQITESRGDSAALRDVQHDASTTPGPPFRNPSVGNWSPRFGFAWDATGDGKTSLRGGFGMLYDLANLGSALTIAGAATPPLSSVSTVAVPGVLSLPLVFPASAAGKSLRTLDYRLTQPYMFQYNLTVERQLPGSMALSVAYAGSRGVNLTRTVEGNPTVPQILPTGQEFWPVGAPRTNPNWSNMEFKTGGGQSWYNALQLTVSKRLSHGIQFQGNYTWSKVLDETYGQFGADDAASSVFGTDTNRPKTDKGPATFDVAQNFRFNTIYNLPQPTAGGFLKGILSGWWTSGILSLQSGYPFTVALGSNRSRSLVNGGAAGIDRPDLIAGRNNSNITSGTSTGCQGLAAGTPLGTPTLFFDPCAFTIPAAGFLGNASRNFLFGPALANLDWSLVKDTAIKRLGEAGRLQFRLEVFNLLNHANFSIPSRNVFAGTQNVEAPLATAGVITNTVTPARQIQLALKLIF